MRSRMHVGASGFWSRALPAACVAAIAMACADSAPTTPSAGDSGASTSPGAAAAMGTLTVKLTDSPFSDAQALLITFSEVSVHKADPGAWLTVPFAAGSTRTCDLKKLNGPVDILGVGSLPAGHYTQIRLHVESAALYFDAPSVGSACAASIAAPGGDFAPVEIPSGEVKLNHQFTLASGGTTLTLDFDGDKSVKQTGGGNSNGNGKGKSEDKGNSKYMMSPVVRVVSVQ
jgi:hypothetical protein